ncbi:MAG: hypothetical protein DHS20C14_09950 [Phycisphaeraceae bacterium]|nr:MAG: hypothetical protein DHS20C14_09950 [Phycisphaeraceae bacterium]
MPVPLDRGDPFARAVRAAWRRLTGGRGVRDEQRRTLIACSGGADSSALVLALAAVDPGPVVAHVVHDLRPREQTLADRDSVRGLVAGLGLDYVEAQIAVRDAAGNAEANAREARYAALERLAGEVGVGFVATGHHGDDQLETMLMRLVRGAGPGGLAGIHPTRALGPVTLVRPMLGVTHAACEDACGRAGWVWREDATNDDTMRLRAAIRATVAPELRRLAPGLAGRLARTSELLSGAEDVVRERAAALTGQGDEGRGRWAWARAALASEPGVVVGCTLRGALVQAGVGADDAAGARIEPIVRAIREGVDDIATFGFGNARVTVSGAHIEIYAESGTAPATGGTDD